MEAATWRHLKSILEQALERAEDDRRDYVAQACVDSPYLRAKVNSLLDEADAPTNNFLEFPARFPGISSYSEPAWVGKQVGSFRVVRRIALGGMGQIYFAEHEDGRRRQTVVIKAMRGDVDSQAMRRRFEQERWIHAQLDHPFIARMVERGTIEGQPCMVLEHIEGLPIDEHCRIHRLSLRERISLVRRVCAAVHHVHSASIVHCDIKPANVLVTSDGVPKLLDFGIAEVLSPREPTQGAPCPQLKDVALFTPECAAPEQLRGEAPTVAIDIYGLGLLLYRLLTGRTPHAAHRNSPALMKLRAVRDVDAMPASQAVEHFPPDGSTGLPEAVILARTLKGSVDALLSKALSRTPGCRQPNAATLSADLRMCLDEVQAL